MPDRGDDGAGAVGGGRAAARPQIEPPRYGVATPVGGSVKMTLGLAGWCSLSLGAWLPRAAPDQARAGGHGAADSFLVLSGGGRRGRARRVASATGGSQQHGHGSTARNRCAIAR